MKNGTWVLVKLFPTLLLLVGCQWDNGTLSSGSDKEAVANHAAFPELLVGIWKSNDTKWILTFEPDGSISRFRHGSGIEFEVDEGGLVDEWAPGVQAFYALGPCQARYEPEKRELSVTITIQHYVFSFPDGTIEGNNLDQLTGPVSQDGDIWTPTWTSSIELVGSGLRTSRPQQLTFTKASDQD
jgi:hypothetical protein